MRTVPGLLGTVSDMLENTASCACHMSSPVLSLSGSCHTAFGLLCVLEPLLPGAAYLPGWPVKMNVHCTNSFRYYGALYK
jgi:hypothetical protein